MDLALIIIMMDQSMLVSLKKIKDMVMEHLKK